MEFYKVYQIVHHHTAWFRLHRWEREVMMPEWYEERRKQGETAMRRLAIMSALVYSMCDRYR